MGTRVLADWVVATATAALAIFAGAQIWLSRKQAEDNNRQLDLLRDQTELLRQQTELLVRSRLPKLDVRLESTTEHPFVRACVRNEGPSTFELRGLYVVPWPEGLDDPIDHPGPRPFGTPNIDLSTRIDGDSGETSHIPPGEKDCFDLIGGDNIVDYYRKNPSEAPGRLAAVAIVGYPPSPSSTLYVAFPVRVDVVPDTGRFYIYTLPGKPLYADGDREISA